MRVKFEYETGETVRIKSGPFASFTGRIVEVDREEERLKVTVRFMNEWRVLKLRFPDVEKAPSL